MKKKLFIEITIDQNGKSEANVNSIQITDSDLLLIIAHLRIIESNILNKFIEHINTQEQ